MTAVSTLALAGAASLLPIARRTLTVSRELTLAPGRRQASTIFKQSPETKIYSSIPTTSRRFAMTVTSERQPQRFALVGQLQRKSALVALYASPRLLPATYVGA